MANVSFRQVRKSYGSMPILHGIDLEIANGEFVVLVGPSGCGKTTLLRMVAGLEDITDGEIFIDGSKINNLPPKSRDIAMVFQNYALYPHMTVAENLSFALRLRKVSEEEVKNRTAKAADILGLSPYLKRFPRQLSGGQRQRVAMGRAIVREPKAFLFDEPLSNLDAKLRVSMRAEIKTLQNRLQTTSIYVTHDQAEAMTMADRIVVMNEGRIEQQGEPLAIYDRPTNKFVAGFIGSPAMNFMPAELSQDEGRLVATFGKAGHLALQQAKAEINQSRVEIGIRPEYFKLHQPGKGGYPLTAEVVVVEPTGLDTMLYVKINGVQVCALLRERVNLQAGENILLTVDGPMLVFDPATGHTLL